MVIKIHGNGQVSKNHKETSSQELPTVSTVLIVLTFILLHLQIQTNLRKSETNNI